MRSDDWVPYDLDIDIMVVPESIPALIPALLQDKTEGEEWEVFWFLADKFWYVKDPTGAMMPPEDPNDIRPYFEDGCVHHCWDGDSVPLVKIFLTDSCLSGNGHYLLDVFLNPPKEMPSSLRACTLDGLPTLCPGDSEGWLFREYGDWQMPDLRSDWVNILQKSPDPYHRCT